MLWLAGCPKRIAGGYEVSDGKVIYHHGMKGLGTTRASAVKEADPTTFEALDRKYGRDKNHAYYDGRIIDGSDGPTFKLIEGQFSGDKNHIYYTAQILTDRPADFKILFKTKPNVSETTFSTDGKLIFMGNKPFFPDLVHVPTFERLGRSDYFRDRNRVYTPLRVVKGADASSFEVVKRFDERYSYDANSVFYFGVKVEGIDRATHRVIDNVHHRDQSNIYFAMKQLSDDPDNFKILSKAFSKDSTRVYWRGRQISDDAANFVQFPSRGADAYAKDSKKAYWGWKTIEGVDVESFEGLNDNYAKDKNAVYFAVNIVNMPRKMEGADPATFALVKGEKGIDARDKNRAYNFGNPKRRN
ncbi:MAG: DKNYY domain-containing protein [Pyrinomonadaceae bacterium]|nr:DKNYY domain-containing protein [Pyrinomonadaceae bacterium]